MSVKIRLKRMGRKKQPTFRIVIAESRNPAAGKVIETVGYYSPYMKDKPLKINSERIQEWRDKGAIPTESVLRLLRRARRDPDSSVKTVSPAKAVESDAKAEPLLSSEEPAPEESTQVIASGEDTIEPISDET